MLPPDLDFLEFFQDDVSLAPAVFSSCTYTPQTHFDTGLVRSGCYGYEISSRWSNHFLTKSRVFRLFRRKKYKLFTKGSKVFNYVILYMSSINNFQLPPFLTISTFGQNPRWWPRWRQRPPAVPQPIMYTSSSIAYQRLSNNDKTFVKYCFNTAKTQRIWEGVPSTSPPPLLIYTTVGVGLYLYVGGLRWRRTLRQQKFPASYTGIPHKTSDR